MTTPPKKRMTAKERVLAVYPKAYSFRTLFRYYEIHEDKNQKTRGRGATPSEAWAAAARSLP